MLTVIEWWAYANLVGIVWMLWVQACETWT
jgi:hypothetical protein